MTPSSTVFVMSWNVDNNSYIGFFFFLFFASKAIFRDRIVRFSETLIVICKIVHLAGSGTDCSNSGDWCHSFPCGYAVTEIWQPGKLPWTNSVLLMFVTIDFLPMFCTQFVSIRRFLFCFVLRNVCCYNLSSTNLSFPVVMTKQCTCQSLVQYPHYSKYII